MKKAKTHAIMLIQQPMFCPICAKMTAHTCKSATVQNPYHTFTCEVCGYGFLVRINPWALAKLKKEAKPT